MNSALLDIVQGDNGSYYFENAAESLIYALIGIVVVFAGIALLIGILYLVSFIIKKVEKIKLPSSGHKQTPSSEGTADDELPDEVKAAIVAAVMSYYAEVKLQCEIVVKRIKRL